MKYEFADSSSLLRAVVLAGAEPPALPRTAILGDDNVGWICTLGATDGEILTAQPLLYWLSLLELATKLAGIPVDHFETVRCGETHISQEVAAYDATGNRHSLLKRAGPMLPESALRPAI